ncbi:methyltransferase domain-containing protein [Salinibaculum rarum]|uniref:methyltransferase domain-containing protein n=1 Tax=Salinibaculum rarum TaxID=3058903 RepID=UPI00265E79E5|nr:methyltransferase domain-containing protein [Salinibaculum sp. KK48]
MSFLLVHEDREYLLGAGDRLETDLGILEVPEDATAGDTVETHLGTVFRVRKLRGPDLFHHLERTGAPMMPRDIGLIVGHTGIESDDAVLDAGTGTGVLASYLGRIGVDVTTFERDADFADVARENMELASVADCVDVRTGDVTEHLGELDTFDVLTLDTEDAASVVEHTPNLLVSGGYVAVYSPFVEQTREVVETAHDVGLSDVETVETIQREMDFDDRGSRPSTAGVGHTGYLTFARRL